MRFPWPVIAVALVISGCTSLPEPSPPRPGEAYAEQTRTDPSRMEATPVSVPAGGDIEVVFPRGTTRGPGFVLERATDEGWAWWFAISSDTDAPDMVNTFTAEEFVARNVAWDSGPAFDGTDPHLIPVPEDAEPGRWRVCTAPDTPGLCAEFEVTANGA